MKIQFSDLRLQHREIKRDIDKAVSRVIAKSEFILGEEVAMFEKEFAHFCQAGFAAGASSGTAALFLALKALGIKEGDEVIVPVFTYIATAFAVSYTGARPVFVDIDEKTYNIDPLKIEEAINKNTKAIIPVHLYGQPADMPWILRIAKRERLKVIEDAAQAHGAGLRINGRWKRAGGLGDMGCFSFYPSKNLGALGDAGAVVTNDKGLYQRVMMLRDHGRISKYEHALIGYNARLDNLQAAILRVKLRRLELWNQMRRKAAVVYNKALADIDGVITPYASPSARHVYHVYAIRTRRRDEVFQRLKKENIGAIIHYPIPLHLQEAYASLGYHKGDFPVAEEVAGEIISLPMYPHLKGKEIELIAAKIKKAARG